MKHKKDIIYLFICTLPVSAILIYLFVLEGSYRLLPFALIPQLFTGVCIWIMLLQEKLITHRTQRAAERPGAELRQEALENYEKKAFREIKADSVSADLRAVYRRKYAPRSLLYGVCCLALSGGITAVIMSFIEYARSITAIAAAVIFGLAALVFFIEAAEQFAGIPVKAFEKKNREELPMIERSYMGGRMILNPLSGLNIGIDYIVSIESSVCECFRIPDITAADVLFVTDTKRDRAGFITKQEFSYVVRLFVRGRKKPVKHIVNAVQSEYIRDELMRHGMKLNDRRFTGHGH